MVRGGVLIRGVTWAWDNVDIIFGLSTGTGAIGGTLIGSCFWVNDTIDNGPSMASMGMVPLGLATGAFTGFLAPFGVAALPFVGVYRLFKKD